MRLLDSTDPSVVVLLDILAATMRLLAQLQTIERPAERAALAAALELDVERLREELARRQGLDERAADTIMAGALRRAAELLQAADRCT